MKELKDIKILQLDTPNRNGIIYPKEEIQRVIENIEQPILGECGSPHSQYINLGNVCSSASNLRIVDGWLIGDVKLLDTPMGIPLQALPHDTCRFAVRGTGMVAEDNAVSDYTLFGIDALYYPGEPS